MLSEPKAFIPPFIPMNRYLRPPAYREGYHARWEDEADGKESGLEVGSGRAMGFRFSRLGLGSHCPLLICIPHI